MREGWTRAAGWTTIAVFLVFAPWGASVAMGVTPEEQAELAADAVDDPVPVSHATPETITCDPGTPVTLYFSDFETDDGGWTITSAAAEWEHGAVAPGVFEGCDSTTYDGPSGAYSGSNAWATNLDGCYPNIGAATVLAQTFDLTSLPAGTPVQLEWWHWYHVFETFDYAQAFVNGTEVWRTPDSNPSATWEQMVVDLTPYAGSTVDIEFSLYMTTVVNRPGWYIDDIEISYCDTSQPPEPAIPTIGTVGIVVLIILIAIGAAAVLRRQ